MLQQQSHVDEQQQEALLTLTSSIQDVKNNSDAVKDAQEALRKAELDAVYSSLITTLMMDKIVRSYVTKRFIDDGAKIANGTFADEKLQRRFKAITEDLKKDNRYYNYKSEKYVILNTEDKLEQWYTAVSRKYAILQGEVKARKAKVDDNTRIRAKFDSVAALLGKEADKDAIIAYIATIMNRTKNEVREALGM